MQRFHELYEQVWRSQRRLICIDEAHIQRDMDVGYTWAVKGKPAWRLSDSVPLAHRINWYGVYDFAEGRCFIWNEGTCNKEHTIQFLQRMAACLADAPGAVVIIWDGAPWHRAKCVQAAADELDFTLIALSAYSPDLNPIEGLWKWMREEVTRHHCHDSMRQLFDACKEFIVRINDDPITLVYRLWPKFELDPDYEKLLVSNCTHFSFHFSLRSSLGPTSYLDQFLRGRSPRLLQFAVVRIPIFKSNL